MKNDYNNILELKKGNNVKEKFYKDKLLETAKNLGIENITDEEIAEIFNEAVNTYKESTPVPFIFFMNGLLKKRNKKEYEFSKIEIDVINLYLGNTTNTYPKLEEIARTSEISNIRTSNILTTFETLRENEPNTVLKTFPNYQEQLEKRREFYRSKSTLNDEDLEILGYLIGKINKRSLNVKELVTKYNTNYKYMQKRITHIFNILKIPKNLKKVTDKYGDVSSLLVKKAKHLDLKIDFYIPVTTKKVVKERKIRIKKDKLTDGNIKLIESIKRKYEENLTEIQFIEICDVEGNTQLLQNQINGLYKRILKSNILLNEALSIYEDILKVRTISTVRDRQILELVLKQEKEHISDKEINEFLKYKESTAYKGQRDRIFNRLYKEEDFRKEILKIYPDIIKTVRYNEFTNKKIGEQLSLEYNRIKSVLELIITDNNTSKTTKEKALYLHRNIDENELLLLPKSMKDIVKNINEAFFNDLPLNEIIANIGYYNIEILVNYLYSKLEREKLEDGYMPTQEEIQIMRELYTPTETGYRTNEEVGRNYQYGKNKISKIKRKVLESAATDIKVLDSISENWESFKEDVLIKDNFNSQRCIPLTEDELNNIREYGKSNDYIIEGIYKLNTSVYGEYAETRDINDQYALALRLGFYNNHPFSSSEVAEKLEREEEDIIKLTKECLIASKDNLNQKGPRKIKI